MLSFKEKVKLQRKFNKINKTFSKAENIARKVMYKAGIRYKYQKVISNMIVDFFLPKRLLIIEIDGPEHNLEKDSKRNLYLQSIGFKVLRFSNNLILTNPNSILNDIKEFPESKQNQIKSKEILKSIGSWINNKIFKDLKI